MAHISLTSSSPAASFDLPGGFRGFNLGFRPR